MARLKNIGAGGLVLPRDLGEIAPGQTVTVDDGVLAVPGVAEWLATGLAEEVKRGRPSKSVGAVEDGD